MLLIKPHLEPRIKLAREHADVVDSILFSYFQREPKMRRSLENTLEFYRTFGCCVGDEVPDVTKGKVELLSTEGDFNFYFQMYLWNEPTQSLRESMNGMMHYHGPPPIYKRHGLNTNVEKGAFTKMLITYDTWGWSSHT